MNHKWIALVAGLVLAAGGWSASRAARGVTASQEAQDAQGAPANKAPGGHQGMNHSAMNGASTNGTAAGAPVPAYHAKPSSAAEKQQTMDPELFQSNPAARNAYAMAAKVKGVLYQQPCYCYCDHSKGHASLLSCYTGDHAAYCGVCQKEAIYAYQQTRRHETPQQIRAGIMRGDWKKIDLALYSTPKSY